jgi:hypothetical protein
VQGVLEQVGDVVARRALGIAGAKQSIGKSTTKGKSMHGVTRKEESSALAGVRNGT